MVDTPIDVEPCDICNRPQEGFAPSIGYYCTHCDLKDVMKHHFKEKKEKDKLRLDIFIQQVFLKTLELDDPIKIPYEHVEWVIRHLYGNGYLKDE